MVGWVTLVEAGTTLKLKLILIIWQPIGGRMTQQQAEKFPVNDLPVNYVYISLICLDAYVLREM